MGIEVISPGGDTQDIAADGEDISANTSVPGQVSFDLNDDIDLRTLTFSSGVKTLDVRLCATAALPACTYNQPGGAGNGVGATLTANANGAIPDQDYVAVALNDRIVIPFQADLTQNGVYTVNDLGSAGTPWQMTRVVEADETADWADGLRIEVAEGICFRGSTIVFSGGYTVTMGTTNIVFDGSRGVNTPSDSMYGFLRDRGRYATHFEELQTTITTSGDRIPGTPYSHFNSATAAAQCSQAGAATTLRGVAQLETGTNAAGWASVAPAGSLGGVKSFAFSNGKFYRAAFRLAVPTLTGGGNEFTLRLGASNTMTLGTAPASGVYFESVNEANWFCVCRNAGVSTRLDSGVAIATGFRLLVIDYNPITGDALFFVGTTLVQTINTNKPDGVGLFSGGTIIKTLGAGNRTLQIDHMVLDEPASVLLSPLTP